MTILFDSTVQHSGWAGPDFDNGGWHDSLSPLVTGVSAQSFLLDILNREPTDVGLYFEDPPGVFLLPPFYNQHVAGTAQGGVSPNPFPVRTTSRLHVYSRVPQSNLQILLRVRIADTVTTPPPSSPP